MAIVADEKRNNVEVMEKPALSDDRTMIAPADGGEESTPAKLRHAPPYIVVIDGPRIGVHFPLTEGQNIIGRATGCAVRLDDQSVSRQHAEIVKGASGWSVKDLGSKNGTSVNGKPVIDVVIIGHKDVVKTGIYQLRLITQPISVEDEMTIPAEITVADRTVFVSAPPESQTTKMKEKQGHGKTQISGFKNRKQIHTKQHCLSRGHDSIRCRTERGIHQCIQKGSCLPPRRSDIVVLYSPTRRTQKKYGGGRPGHVEGPFAKSVHKEAVRWQNKWQAS